MRDERNLVPAHHQFYPQRGDDAFDSAVELRRHGQLGISRKKDSQWEGVRAGIWIYPLPEGVADCAVEDDGLIPDVEPPRALAINARYRCCSRSQLYVA